MMHNRILVKPSAFARGLLLLAAGILPAACSCSRSNPFPEIDYASPAAYTALPDGGGSRSLVDSIAGSITGAGPEQTIASVWFWIHDNLRFNPDPEQVPATFEDFVRAGIYTGSTSHAVIFGTLCRAKGIPAVWVNCADDAWIIDFLKQGEQVPYHSGYTYVECHLNGTWKLVDAFSGSIYDTYDPFEPNLPKQRYAFAKRADPYALARYDLPDEWIAAVVTSFTGFNRKKLRTVDSEGRDFLMEGFKGRRPSMGVKIQNTDSHKGVQVIYVAPGYPAAAAGVEPGDVILKVDSTPISDIYQLVDLIIHKGFGSSFAVTVDRDGRETTLPVTIPAAGSR